MEMLSALVGTELDGRYLLRSVIGEGGSAVVFEAEDVLLSRTVAIKMLRSESMGTAAGTAASPTRATKTAESETRKIARAAFLREAHAATVLSHPAVVSVFDVCDHPDHPYIVMELVRGKTLASRIKRRGAMMLGELLSIAHEVLEALVEAHAHGIVHRDIKADNILLCKEGVRIADFGIAKIPGNEKRILENKVLGSVDTISPEQAMGKPVDGRSDLYSLGVLLYQMATGELPFTADTPDGVAFLHIHEPPRHPSSVKPDIPVGLEQIILCAMEKNPDDRFENAASMLEAIKHLEHTPTHVFHRFTRARRSPLSALARYAAVLSVSLGVIAAVLCGLFVFLFSGEEILPTPVTVISLPSYTEAVYPAVLEDITALDPRINVTLTCVLRPDLPEGTVLAQMPEAGTLFKLDGAADTVSIVLIVTTQKANNPGLPPSFFG